MLTTVLGSQDLSSLPPCLQQIECSNLAGTERDSGCEPLLTRMADEIRCSRTFLSSINKRKEREREKKKEEVKASKGERQKRLRM